MTILHEAFGVVEEDDCYRAWRVKVIYTGGCASLSPLKAEGKQEHVLDPDLVDSYWAYWRSARETDICVETWRWSW